MVAPIPPHGFQSQIPSQDLHLPKDLMQNLQEIFQKLQEMKKRAQDMDLHGVVKSFESYDQSHTHFLVELNKLSDRGYEKSVKNKIEIPHHRLMERFDDIQDIDGKSLRDILSSYDPQEMLQFLESLNSASFQQITQSLEEYIKDLHFNFNINT
jgi:hypothetical protein